MDRGTTLPRRLTSSEAHVSFVDVMWRGVVARGEGIALAGITAVGLGMRLWGLSAKSLWIDETFSIGMATQSWGSFIHTVAGVQPNMEVFYLLLKLAVTFTPASWQSGEFFWRVLPALFGAATIPAIYALAKQLFSIRVALASAELLAVNEFMVEYSQQARGYTLFVLLLTLSWLALARWLESGSRRDLAWFAALSVLGFLTQAFEVIFLAAQLAFVLVIALHRRSLPWRGLALALIPTGLIVALRYPIYAAHPDQVAWIQRPTTSDLFHGARQLVGGDGGVPNRLGDLLLLLVIACLAGLISRAGWGVTGHGGHGNAHGEHGNNLSSQKISVSSVKNFRDLRVPSFFEALDRVEAIALIAIWFALPIALTWVGSQVKPVWVTRYLAPCSVAACIIVAAGLELAAKAVGRVKWQNGSFAALVGLVLCGWLGPLHDYQARAGWEDWRGAAISVNARFQAGDGIVCYDNQWGCDLGFSHYFQSFGGPAHFDVAAPGTFSWATYARADREAIFARAVEPAYLAPYLARHGRVWVLLGHYASGTGDWRAGLAWLNVHAHLVNHSVFAGDIEVFLFALGGNQADVNHNTGS